MPGKPRTSSSGGYMVTWEADVRTRPDAGDAVPCLRRSLKALRGHPEVASATCRYLRREGRVSFGLQIGHALTPDFAMVRAGAALRDSLDRAGVGFTRPHPGAAAPMAQLRMDRGPAAIERA